MMSAARNYLSSLNGELAGTGVYAGTLAIASVGGSELAEAAAQPDIPAELPGGVEIPTVDPDDLAEHYWDMYTRRDRVEQICPESLVAQAVTA
ncbi:hypothetical protein [Actinophytocola sp.]|uniref:hypothetical protein n=1 Tax=Actinophytocola sp. TaxID=1872138 RepID=UPI002ED334A6